MMNWSTAVPAISAAFVASLVEAVEAFTIVLAVATLRGCGPRRWVLPPGLVCWRASSCCSARFSTASRFLRCSSRYGIMLLLFGMGWLRKASLRAAGVIPLHDEEAIFAAEAAELSEPARGRQRNLSGPPA